MRLLIVEDDRKLARLIKKGLEDTGNSAIVTFDGPEGLAAAQEDDFDAIILDVMLPRLDGFSIVRRLRSDGVATPILLLTGRDTNEDLVFGLDAGADDYLTKPFSFKVLLARLRALARRKQVDPRMYLQVGDLVLDPATYEVHRAGVLLSLTKKEFLLLEFLTRNAGRVLTRDRLIEVIWGSDTDVESNSLDVLIRQLRSKVDVPGSRRLIHTVRGIGYAVREEDMT
jgi:DNA-binding response OmpR family regulator